MALRLFVTQILFFVVSSTAMAQTEKTLFDQRNWLVTEVFATADGGEPLCIAETTNGPDLLLLMIGGVEDFFEITFVDERWDLAERQVRFGLKVDDNTRPIVAMAAGSSVSIDFSNDIAEAQRFMSQISSTNSLAIISQSGTELARSVNLESTVPMEMMAECWARIQKPDASLANPFATPVWTSKDSSGIIYSVTEAVDGSTPDGKPGTVFRSINTGATDHVSFAMYADCSAFSLTHGWGNWSWSNAGFSVGWSNAQYYGFPRGEVLLEGTGCQDS